MRDYRPWTTTELAVVRDVYPTGGTRACAEHLDRTRKAIRSKAHEEGITADTRNVQLLARGLEDEVDG